MWFEICWTRARALGRSRGLQWSCRLEVFIEHMVSIWFVNLFHAKLEAVHLCLLGVLASRSSKSSQLLLNKARDLAVSETMLNYHSLTLMYYLWNVFAFPCSISSGNALVKR